MATDPAGEPGVDRWLTTLPRWWLLVVWIAIDAVTAYQAHGTAARIAAGALMVLASGSVQFTADDRPPLRTSATLLACGAGMVAIVVAPSGLGYVPVVIAVGRLASVPSAKLARALMITVAVLFGLSVGWATRSVAGLLAGTAVPVLFQRVAERQQLVIERDRARALLVELEASRSAEAQAAALRERGRIARDMHDLLAHSLAGLSLQLQATRAIATKSGVGPEVIAPLDRAAELAREGLVEARSAVGALRDTDGPGLDELAALVARYPGAAGLTVTGSGTTAAGAAVYRAVQESLTNAARYAPGSRVDVRVSWHAGELTVSVEDSGPAEGHRRVDGQGSGLGLSGMATRVAEAGGRMTAGPGAGGGWRVEVVIPR
jgi:signal transduction histidine kinase